LITIISAISGLPTSYPYEGYGGIESLAAGLAHHLAESGYEVRVVGYTGSRIDGVEVVQYGAEGDVYGMGPSDGAVIDFSHGKTYLHRKVSIPFWSDVEGTNPIYPTNAVRWSFNRMSGSVIYPGIDPSPYYISDPEDYYLTFSRIAPYKGVHEAIYVAKQLGIRLLVAGHVGRYADPGYVEWVKSQCTGNIEWVGEVDNKRKIELMSKAKGTIFLPNWQALRYNTPRPVESFGISVVESLMCGTPVFTVNNMGGHVEILSRVMQSIPPGMIIVNDNWRSMLSYTVNREKLAEAARYFSVGRYAKELIDAVHG
jgi:glycosyltransferase involved in cell wall biosynthesis